MPQVSSLVEALLKPREQYLADEPFFMSGRNLLSTQLAQPQNSTQAFLMPILQGLSGGLMQGYGERRADEAITGDTRSTLSRLLNQPDYQLPENFNPESANASIASAVLDYQQNQALELERVKQDAELANSLLKNGIVQQPSGAYAVDSSLVTAQANAAGQIKGAQEAAKQVARGAGTSTLPGALGDFIKQVPPQFQAKAIEEQGAQTRLKELATLVASSYDDTKVLDPYKVNLLPYSNDAKKLEALRGSIWSKIQKGWKGNMSEGEQQRMQGLLPLGIDTPNQIEMKKAEMLKAIEANSEPTPILDTYGLSSRPYTEAATAQAAGGSGILEKQKSPVDAIPPGMKLQRNKRTGETRLVPQ